MVFTALSPVWIPNGNDFIIDESGQFETVTNSKHEYNVCRKFYFDIDGNYDPASTVPLGRARPA